MNTHALTGIIFASVVVAGCAPIQHTTQASDSNTPTIAEQSADDRALDVVDNRELHINSHNASVAPAGHHTTVIANPDTPVRLKRQLGLNGLDSTVFIPSRYLQETPESKSVQTGAAQFAMAKGCMFLQRYRVAINADFTGTLNLMKYRAAGMGSEWINVQFHAESTPFERLFDYGASLFLVDGTQTLDNQVFTVMEADLFDCG